MAPGLLWAGLLGCGADGGASTGMTGGEGGTGGTGGTGGMGGDSGAEVVLPAGTSLLVEVVDPAGAPVSNASILVFGKETIAVDSRTNEQGMLLLENLDPGRLVAQVRAKGFTEAVAVAELESDAHEGARVVLNPLGTPMDIDLNTESTVKLGGVEVTIPANAMVDELGKPVSGPAAVTIVPLDPTGSGLGAMPGPLEGSLEEGADPVNLESIFMADISVWKDGQHLQLAEGKRATLKFPIPDKVAAQYKVDDTIDAWSFSVPKGRWEKEGQGVVTASPDDPTKLVWVTQAPHFSWWNCDAYWGYKTLQCFKVTVHNGQTLLPNQWVTAVGLSYTGISQPVTTNGYGQACVNVKAGSSVRIYNGWTGNPNVLPSSNTFVNVYSPNYYASCANPASCQPVTIQLPSPQVCVPGSTRACPYSGPAGTLNVGACRAPVQTCNVWGSGYTACGGEITPQQEICNNWKDDDCDGPTDEGCVNECTLGQTRPCYSGPAGTAGVGICKQGTQACVQTPTGNRWDSTCTGQVTPLACELCSNSTDDNCNGTQGECQCTVGQTRPCYNGPAGTQGVGDCKGGTQTCEQTFWLKGGSVWGACQGQVLPQPKESCSLAGDENCDGKSNEAPLCCATNADCGLVQDACFSNKCVSGTCVTANYPYGGVTPFQTIGDCMTQVCDGNGGQTKISDPTDAHDDGNACTKNVCSATPHPPEPSGTTCNENGGKVCDGAGKCVECVQNADCGSNLCTNGKCVVSCGCTCSDKIKNGDETDIDCGGSCVKKCGNTFGCSQNSDCASLNCVANKCKAADCTDGKQDGQETDVDCGGIQCDPCPTTKKCSADYDCLSQSCTNGICD